MPGAPSYLSDLYENVAEFVASLILFFSVVFVATAVDVVWVFADR